MYYLQSRYYDPEVGRFLNADALVSTGQGIIGNNMFAYCGNNAVNYSDPTGSFWRIILGAFIVAVAFGGCSSDQDVGAAPEYVDIPASDGNPNQDSNCYTYALGIYDCAFDPGTRSHISYDFLKTCYDYDINNVVTAVIGDLHAMGRSARIIEGPDSPIESNEYRIALRVGKPRVVVVNGQRRIDWDYHFMVQTSSGGWAEKCGRQGATRYHAYGTPDTISWDRGSYRGYYEGRIVYLAITKG